ncbi:hypothetical protein ACFXPA_34845 [Amycolatopsis sp. NPDC059090]|uniref:hypothetical protein n=1 Tax=unclassified Amycolatopsis TaxID=2618356 RepID=UPI00366F73D2
MLKTKLVTAVIGISSVHLLRTFVQPARVTDTGRIDWQTVMWQAILHSLLVLSAIGLAAIDRIMTNTEASKHSRHVPVLPSPRAADTAETAPSSGNNVPASRH